MNAARRASPAWEPVEQAGPWGCAGAQSNPPEERGPLWFLFSLPRYGYTHPIPAAVVLPFSGRRDHTSEKSCHLGAQAGQTLPDKAALQLKIQLVTPDAFCEASAGLGNFGLSVKEIKMWVFSAKSLTGMSPSQRDSSEGKTSRFVQGTGQGCELWGIS